MYKDKLQIKARDRENGWTCDLCAPRLFPKL